MKTHIMRWAAMDWRTSRVRARSARTADPMLRLVYFEALNALFEAGGTLPADPEALADELLLPAEEIARCLPILDGLARTGTGAGGLRVEDGSISNPRVTRDLTREAAYRDEQAEKGRRGGRAAGGKRRPSKSKAAAKQVKSPPAPAPAPAPTPSPSPLPSPLPFPTPSPEPTERALVPSGQGEADGNGHGSAVIADQRPAYAQAVWAEFLRVTDGAASRVMSPAEFAVLRRWMDDGIPLRVVLRGIKDTAGKGGALGYYAPSVADAVERWRRAVQM